LPFPFAAAKKIENLKLRGRRRHDDSPATSVEIKQKPSTAERKRKGEKGEGSNTKKFQKNSDGVLFLYYHWHAYSAARRSDLPLVRHGV
jgi:hypothetical protein